MCHVTCQQPCRVPFSPFNDGTNKSILQVPQSRLGLLWGGPFDALLPPFFRYLNSWYCSCVEELLTDWYERKICYLAAIKSLCFVFGFPSPINSLTFSADQLCWLAATTKIFSWQQGNDNILTWWVMRMFSSAEMKMKRAAEQSSAENLLSMTKNCTAFNCRSVVMGRWGDGLWIR
jgi:hypothetical protein